MSLPRLVVAFALATAHGAVFASQVPGPAIDTAYPPADDVRRPDLTVAQADVGADAVVAYSADGRAVAVGGRDGNVRVRNARTGEDLTGDVLSTLPLGGGRAVALAFGAGDTLRALGSDRTLTTWDLSTGQVARTAHLKVRPDRAALRPGAEPILARVLHGRVELVDGESGRRARTLKPCPGSVRTVAWSADGKRLAGAAVEGHLCVWDAEDGTLLQSLRAFDAGTPVDAVGVSVKGDQVAWVGRDGDIEVWDVATAQRLCRQRGHTGRVAALAFNPNGQKMVSAGADGTVRYWTVPLPPVAPADLEKIAAAVPERAAATPRRPRRLLVFWRADAILHKGGVPAANHALELIGKKTGAYEADFSRDDAVLDPEVLARYDAVVLNNTAHLVIQADAKKALLDYVQNGGGIVGIHSAIDMFKGWPEGAAIIGATFAGHPWHPTGTWAVSLEEPDHPLLRAWGGKPIAMHDEMYELGPPYSRSDRRVLLTLDVAHDAATGGVTPLHREDGDFAVSWIKAQGRGRVFYCMFGHLAEPFQDPRVLQYYLDGIQYALGDLDVDASPRPRTRQRE
jgi:type 1 glutamine amidotransferase